MTKGHAGRLEVEGLGEKVIEGVLAHGQRAQMAPPDSAGGVTAPTEGVATLTDDAVTERWCSDELSAMVLSDSENTKTERKSSRAMRNIEHTEPHPQLFQIPANYAVTESIATTRPATMIIGP